MKLLEYCILNKIRPYIDLNDRQHGFRQNYSTSTACLILKETILDYTKSKSDVYACFIDFKKAFDIVSHYVLLEKLSSCDIPSKYLELMKCWYSNQLVRVKYKSCLSDEWRIMNGVRQGGVLSGFLFTLCINVLLEKIANLNVG